jgi:GNAT superfamily N-acetyltransferase
MWWKETQGEFEARAGASNRLAFRRIVASGKVPGILAYSGRTPVGWCAVEPRDRYKRLVRSRTLAPVDEAAVWSVVCFFVARGFRRIGLQADLVGAALAHASRNGARIVEGYPVDPGKGASAAAWMWTGIASAFRRAGFVEVERRSRTRPIMRYFFERGRRGSHGRPAPQAHAGASGTPAVRRARSPDPRSGKRRAS